MLDLGVVFKANTVMETVEAFLKVRKVDASVPTPAPTMPPSPVA